MRSGARVTVIRRLAAEPRLAGRAVMIGWSETYDSGLRHLSQYGRGVRAARGRTPRSFEICRGQLRLLPQCLRQIGKPGFRSIAFGEDIRRASRRLGESSGEAQ